MKKPMLKFALSALLLSAGALAFAEGVVTLSNGTTTMSWAEFVEALNNPKTVEGVIDSLPAGNAALTAYNTAVANDTKAKTDLTKADADSTKALSDLNNAKKANNVETLTNALNQAKGQYSSDSTALKNYIDSLETCYNDSVAYRSYLLNDSITHLTVTLNGIKDELSSAKDSVAKYQKVMDDCDDALEKYGRTLQTHVLEPWLATIEKAAKNFVNDYNAESPTDSYSVYYKYTAVTGRLGNITSTLTVSFVEPTTTGWTAANVTEFDTFLMKIMKGYTENGTTYPAVTAITNLYLYLGADYSAVTSSETRTAGNGVMPEVVISTLDNALTTVTENTRFQTTVNTTVYPNEANYPFKNNEDKEAIIKDYTVTIPARKALAESNKDKWETKQTSIETKVAQTQTLITATTAHAQLLYNTNIPAALKKWNDAKAGTLTDKDFTDLQAAVTEAQGNVTTAQSNLNNAQANIDAAQKIYDDAAAAYRSAYANAASAASALTTATANAQAAADAIATQNYQAALQDITLTGDVTVTTMIKPAYSGRINGNGFVFNCTTTPVFNYFTGRVNKVAINGTFANDYADGRFVNVAVWTGSTGRYYDDVSPTPTTVRVLGALGYAVRDNFGVDFAKNQLADKSDATIVYDVTVNNSTTSNVQYYATNNGNAFVTTGGALVAIPVNHFAYCADEDIAGKKAPLNVYYGTAGNYKCDNVNIVDKAQEANGNSIPFYAPVDMNVKAVSYNRTFKEGYNSVCLPFDFKKVAGVTSLCTYDSETPEKFFFQIQSNAIPANTPFLLIAENAIELTEPIKDVTIKATPAKMFVSFEGHTANDLSFGTFDRLNATNFDGAQDGYKIYGLNGQKFQAAGPNNTFAAFRMAIRSELVTTQSEADNAPRRIAILDERGIEIGSGLEGIEGVESDATSFSVATGVGEIIFTSEADYGKVEVYSLDGRVAAVADVMVGTSTVNVAKGVYIVMGKKVMVK